MNQKSAHRLKVGEIIAWRGPYAVQKIEHLAIVLGITKKAFRLEWSDGRKKDKRISFEDIKTLSMLRRASPHEESMYNEVKNPVDPTKDPDFE